MRRHGFGRNMGQENISLESSCQLLIAVFDVVDGSMLLSNLIACPAFFLKPYEFSKQPPGITTGRKVPHASAAKDDMDFIWEPQRDRGNSRNLADIKRIESVPLTASVQYQQFVMSFQDRERTCLRCSLDTVC